jgi:hypothetical protein
MNYDVIDYTKVRIAGFESLAVTSKSTYIILANTDENPSDHIEEIYKEIMKINNNVNHVYVDMSSIYGKYGDWMWRCSFIKNDEKLLDDIIYTSVSDIDLDETENSYMSEYIYESQLFNN